MLTREFLRWVFFGTLIAAPISYWFAARWLSGYAYKTGRLDPARCIRHE